MWKNLRLSGSALALYSNVEVMVNHTFLSIEHLCCGLVGIIIDRFSVSIGEVVIAETCTCELCVRYVLKVKTAIREVLVDGKRSTLHQHSGTTTQVTRPSFPAQDPGTYLG